jgi:glycosyltransferase involved in cell wall biosynthesis
MTYHVTLCIQKITDQSGGAEKVLIDLANELDQRGHRVDILCYENLSGEPFYPLRPGILVRNIKPFDARRRSRAWRNSIREPSLERVIERIIHVLDRVPLVCRLVWWLRYGAMISRIRQFIDWHRPDVIIPFMPGIFPYVIVAKRGAEHKPAIIISNHNVPEADYVSLDRWDRNRYDRSLRRRVLKEAEASVVLLPEYRQWFKPSEQRNMVVIGNATYPNPEILDDDLRENVFIAIGRLTKTKNHEVLVRAFALIASAVPDWTVRIFGHGPLEEDLINLIDELDLGERVFLMGQSDQIPKELARAKVMVLPSLHEGFPLVIGEAAISGVPTIGFSDCSGVNRLISHKVNGLLVDTDPDDRVSELSKAMLQLATNEELRKRLSAEAKSMAETGEYSPGRVFDSWSDLIRNVAEQRGKEGKLKELPWFSESPIPAHEIA